MVYSFAEVIIRNSSEHNQTMNTNIDKSPKMVNKKVQTAGD